MDVQVSDVHVSAGEPLLLSAVLDSHEPTATYAWSKDGVAIPEKVEAQFSIARAEITDQGRYAVTVTVSRIVSTPATATMAAKDVQTTVSASTNAMVRVSLEQPWAQQPPVGRPAQVIMQQMLGDGAGSYELSVPSWSSMAELERASRRQHLEVFAAGLSIFGAVIVGLVLVSLDLAPKHAQHSRPFTLGGLIVGGGACLLAAMLMAGSPAERLRIARASTSASTSAINGVQANVATPSDTTLSSGSSIVSKEPVLLSGLAIAGASLAIGLGFNISSGALSAIVAIGAPILSYLARGQVTPTASA